MSPSRTGPIGCLLLALSAGAFLAPKSTAADGTDIATTTAGTGALTMCRNWVVYNSCETYKVTVPERIAVGDKVKLIFGSNLKEYLFHVVSIRRDEDHCTLLSEISGGRDDGEKLQLSPCQTAAKPGSEKR